MDEIPARMRVDKWLWQARLFKTRGLARGLVEAGHLRVNGHRVGKPAHQVAPGDVLRFVQARRARELRIIALPRRRGPAPEARRLYDDLAPDTVAPAAAPKFDGRGRPTKKDRRRADKSRASLLD